MKNYNVLLKLITFLADGRYYSNEQLEKYLGINCRTINNYIQFLKIWGLNIYHISGKGYILSSPFQLLNKKEILPYINLSKQNISIIPIINSTNQYLLDRIDTLSSGDVCISEYQKEGRGRRGKIWFSPFGVNLYLSMYWCFKQKPVTTIGLSLIIGIVITEVIQSLGVPNIKVKWPNDIYLYDRKLAGILVEVSGKIDDIVQVVIGVGINLAMNTTGVIEIHQDWISLKELGMTIDRNKLSVKIINNLQKSLYFFEKNGLTPFISRWKILDNCMNRSVKLITETHEIYGIARGIDKQGRLLLDQNGKISTWIDGEISLRVK
ncbi:bifunctional biotin--[acetyl-CoA-carboxylase] ligase/biotin operon repressor BirA [Pantoea sp. Aalb]|uniref:bifunctional biotin--[acetyl-CoA-carboxylase] ligase/biotin operon repressor BirA n=1 Tax=Pantoea sp. Aalb TaxID=2576762 RepID=UPI00132B10B5|nr:bifunctional biotin--[acetyl-CoA-carboxylase] ligase/biotin operon repressor BirA [Pantoea sp. Aalb]MXP67980.1 bifunctional biotin--[acetyl-CoA-carboxylase] ligase/biotin operon repressor BirA [Pantoea sp. Aalb]